GHTLRAKTCRNSKQDGELLGSERRLSKLTFRLDPAQHRGFSPTVRFLCVYLKNATGITCSCALSGLSVDEQSVSRTSEFGRKITLNGTSAATRYPGHWKLQSSITRPVRDMR